jgi:hypothetical protein
MNFRHGIAPFKQAEQKHVAHFAAPLLALATRPTERGLERLIQHARGHGMDAAADCFDAALEAVQDGIKELEKR